MKRYLIVPVLLLWSLVAVAAGSQYVMRVDGLACPYCAYGIEKKLNAIDGVEKVDVNLDKGLVIVDTKAGVKLTPPAMKKLFNEAGFTFRSMKIKPL